MKDDTLVEVFRGSLEECLQHLEHEIAARAPKGSREIVALRRPMADFCGVQVPTALRWLSTSHRPVGEQYFKLVCYLYLIGYRIVEIERLPKSRQHFIELLGYGLMTVAQAVELTGYSEASTLYHVLMGVHGSSEDKDHKMWTKWKEKKEELTRKKLHAASQFKFPPVPAKPVLGVSAVRKLRPVETLSRQHQATVSIMQGLLTLLEDESFERYVAGHPHELQESANMIFSLSARMSVLSARLIKTHQGG